MPKSNGTSVTITTTPRRYPRKARARRAPVVPLTGSVSLRPGHRYAGVGVGGTAVAGGARIDRLRVPVEGAAEGRTLGRYRQEPGGT